MEDNNYGAARLVLKKLSKKIEANTEASKTKLCKNIAKCKVDNVTRNLKEQINKLELIIVNLREIDVHMDDSEIMTHMLLNLPEEYQKIV